jgi:hypothetical protein
MKKIDTQKPEIEEFDDFVDQYEEVLDEVILRKAAELGLPLTQRKSKIWGILSVSQEVEFQLAVLQKTLSRAISFLK